MLLMPCQHLRNLSVPHSVGESEFNAKGSTSEECVCVRVCNTIVKKLNTQSAMFPIHMLDI
jgi:hypothetical protein